MSDAAMAPLPMPDPETCTAQQATDFLNSLRLRIAEHGESSASNEELACVIRCMARIRELQGGATAAKRKASAPAIQRSLSDY